MITETTTHCWQCEAVVPGGQVRCPACARLQPLGARTDYFTCLGLPHRLQIDLGVLEKRYYALSREMHPDFHQASDDREQSISLENSALLNKAYRTLKNPVDRVKYLIRLVEGRDEALPAKVPQAFLEEVFTLQEMLDEYRATENSETKQQLACRLEEALKILSHRLAQQDRELYDLFSEWDRRLAQARSVDPGDLARIGPDLIEQIKALLSHRSYLQNLQADVEHLLNGNLERREIRH